MALTEAAGDSEAQMRATLEQLCAQQVPGDTHRNLVIHPVFSGRTFKHVLVPIWLLVYMFGSKSFQVVVNGYTGRIAGEVSAQWLEDLLRGGPGAHRRPGLHPGQRELSRRCPCQ